MTTYEHVNKTASKDWLNFALKANGYLHSGQVVAVDQRISRIGTTLTSTFYQLDITYSSDFEGNVPSSCLMKVGKPEMFSITKAEATFYERARSRGPTEGLLTSFATAVDEPLQSAVILLEDRLDCAAPSEWPLPPTLDNCKRAIRSLANVHGRWWNSAELKDPSFEEQMYHPMTAEQRTLLLSSFFTSLGDRLSPDRRATLENLSDRYDRVLQRHIEQTTAHTLVHGDAHFWNFLYPSDVSLPVLIDWQSFSANSPAYDLAYMIALHWFRERRQRFEKLLLHAYLEELQKCGINYRFDDLWHDYRLQVAALMFFPIIQWSHKVPPLVWWSHLDRAFAAFDDLACRELF